MFPLPLKTAPRPMDEDALLSISISTRRLFLGVGSVAVLLYHILFNLHEGTAWHAIPRHALVIGLVYTALFVASFSQVEKRWFKWATDLCLLFLYPTEAAFILYSRGLIVYVIVAWLIVNQLTFTLIDTKRLAQIFVSYQSLLLTGVLALRGEDGLTWFFMLSTLLIVLLISYHFTEQKARDLKNYLHERDKNQRNEGTVVSLLESTDDLIWALDQSYRLTAFNDAFAQAVKNIAQTRVHKGDSMFALSSKLGDELNFTTFYQRALLGEQSFLEQALELEGQSLWFSFSVSPILHDDAVIGVSVIGRNITQRKKLETDLRNRQRRFHNAFAGTKDGIWEWDLETGEFYASPRMKHILGFSTSANPSRMQWIQRVNPADMAGIDVTIKDHMRGLTPHLHSEFRMRRADGTEIWILGRGKAIRDEDGRVLRIVGAISDITQRKRNELLLANILNNSLNGIASWEAKRDESGAIVDFSCTLINPAGETISGVSAEDFVGRSLREILPTAWQNGFFERLKNVVDTGEPVSFKQELPTSQGNLRWNQYVMFPLDNGVGVNYTDITESMMANERLRTLSMVAEKTATAVIVSDAKGYIEWVNDAYTKNTGYTREESIGKRPGDFLQGPESDPEVVTYMGKKLREGVPFEAELINYAKSGNPYWVHVHVNPVFNEQGVIERFIGVETNISKRKQTEIALSEARDSAEAAAHAKSNFLATMSHEIRTPMNAVIGMTGLLLDTHLNEEQRDYAETIRNSGDNLLTVINDILDFSKIDSGKLELEAQTFDLTETVEDVLDLLSAKAMEKSLELTADIAGDLPPKIVSDSTRISQILLNLVGNAIKFTDEGEVRVEVRYGHALEGDEHLLHFSVADTGIGIPADKQARLFKPFSQVDASTTRKYGGTGLGLAICKMLVELMGGEIGIDSTPNEGTTFYFTLKVEVGEQGQGKEKVGHILEDLSDKTILLVDDNATNLRILEKQCQGWGMQPHSTQFPKEAYAWLKEGKQFDLAILDGMMPEWDGEMLATRIRTLPTHTRMPLILLSSMWQEVSAASKSLFACRLSKPVRRTHLLRKVRESLGSKVSPSTQTQKSETNQNMGKTIPLRILLVEDNTVNQKVALRMLSKIGYKADVAANGLEALHAVALKKYDLCFMDMQMPEMDGITATRELHSTHPEDEQRPVIIAMTANAMTGDRDRCIAAGMDDYISKPVKLKNLADAIYRWFGPQAHEQVRSKPIARDGESLPA